MAQRDTKDFKFDIVRHIAVISQAGQAGRIKELNKIIWNGNSPKYDIRSWSQDHTVIGKGITLTAEELRLLKKAIDSEIAMLDEDD